MIIYRTSIKIISRKLNEKSSLKRKFDEKISSNKVITVSYNNLQSEKIKIDRLYGLSLFVLKFQIGIPLNQEIKLIGNFTQN